MSNWIGYVVFIVIGFFLSPYLVHTLGNVRYGIWTMIVVITGYYGLLDLGIYQAVLQYVTRYRAQGKFNELNEIVSTATAILVVGSMLAIVASAIAAWLIPYWIPIEGLPVWKAQLAFFAIGVSVSVGLPLAIYNAVIVACESFHVLSAISIVTRLISAGALVWALASGMGLLGIAMVTLGTSLLGHIARALAANILLKELRVRPWHVKRAACKMLFSYGVWMWVARVGGMLLINIDLLIVGKIYGFTAATYYGIALSLIMYAEMAVQGFSFVLAPVAIAGDATSDDWRVQSVLLRASRVGLMLSGTFFVGFLFLGKEFIAQWMGPSYVSGEEFVSCAAILGVLSIGRVLLAGLIGPRQVLVAKRRVRVMALISTIQGGACAVAAYLCAKYLGVMAVTVAMAVIVLVGHGVVTIYACRLTKVSLLRFARETLLPPAVALTAMAAACVGICALVQIPGWAGIFSRIGLCALAAVIIGAALCLTREERQTVVQGVKSRFAARRR